MESRGLKEIETQEVGSFSFTLAWLNLVQLTEEHLESPVTFRRTLRSLEPFPEDNCEALFRKTMDLSSKRTLVVS